MNVLCVPRSVVSCALTSHLDTSANASVVSSSPKTIALVSVGSLSCTEVSMHTRAHGSCVCVANTKCQRFFINICACVCVCVHIHVCMYIDKESLTLCVGHYGCICKGC